MTIQHTLFFDTLTIVHARSQPQVTASGRHDDLADGLFPVHPNLVAPGADSVDLSAGARCTALTLVTDNEVDLPILRVTYEIRIAPQ